MKNVVFGLHFVLAVSAYLIPMFLIFQIETTEVFQELFATIWMLFGWIFSIMYMVWCYENTGKGNL